MSQAFQKALQAHGVKTQNYLEFRRVWSPVWAGICRTGDVYFPQEANLPISNAVVAFLLVTNTSLGREILGTVEHNRLVALVNDAMAKFNLKATSSDPNTHKVLSALNEAINNGNYS